MAKLIRFSSPQPFRRNEVQLTQTGPVASTHLLTAAGNTADAKSVAKFELEGGKKWIVEHQQGKHDLLINKTEHRQTVYIYKCEDCTVTVNGKVNAIIIDSCRRTAVKFDEAISSLEFINCQRVQAQVMAKVPTISIDKTDGCMVYLSKDSLETQIVTAKSSEMNMLIPDSSGDFKEVAVPEQFMSRWDGKKLITETYTVSSTG